MYEDRAGSTENHRYHVQNRASAHTATLASKSRSDKNSRQPRAQRPLPQSPRTPSMGRHDVPNTMRTRVHACLPFCCRLVVQPIRRCEDDHGYEYECVSISQVREYARIETTGQYGYAVRRPHVERPWARFRPSKGNAHVQHQARFVQADTWSRSAPDSGGRPRLIFGLLLTGCRRRRSTDAFT